MLYRGVDLTMVRSIDDVLVIWQLSSDRRFIAIDPNLEIWQ